MTISPLTNSSTSFFISPIIAKNNNSSVLFPSGIYLHYVSLPLGGFTNWQLLVAPVSRAQPGLNFRSESETGSLPSKRFSLPNHIADMPAAIFVIDANEELIYRGEGNSSLVVALKSKRQVLRLLKSDAKKLQQKNDENVRSLLLQHIDYNESVLSLALPKFFFTPPKLVCLDHEQLEAIRALVKGKRPSFRLGKTISNCDYALLMPDYCTIPKCVSTLVGATGQTLSIEIKPKQGFLPMLSLLSDPTLAIKSKVCRFGLSQFYKLQKKSINALSSYCPLDLFSGCRTRALHALFNLVLSPQNNFRVFADANLVYGDQASFGKSSNLKFLQEVLSKFLFLDTSYLSNQTEQKENDKDNSLKRSNNSEHNQSYNTRNGSSHNDAIAIFCNLLLSSLYNDKISLDNCGIENIVPIKFSILEQLTIAKATASLNEPCFLGTFLAMFDSTLAPLPTPSVESVTAKEIHFAVNGCSQRDDVKNNNNNGNIYVKGRNNNEVESNKTGNGYTNGNGHLHFNSKDVLNNNFQLIEQNENVSPNSFNNDNNSTRSKQVETINKTTTSQLCILHQKRPKCICSDSNHPNLKNEACSAKLPAGSVLGSILRAQKLDNLDSLKAVELYENLCERYQVLKTVHYDWLPDFVDSFSNEKYVSFVEAFIASNLVDLEKFWSFLVSLTAKDCSLMVAIQRAEHHSLNSSSSSSEVVFSSASKTPIWCSVHTEPTTGHRYVVSISLTDLDFKQAYKVERSLHNDRRMVKAFWSALAAEPTAFPADLHSCDLRSSTATLINMSATTSHSLLL